jgi:hypothetical protein
MNDSSDALALRAGPPPNSPPLPIALMLVALGIFGPILFVRDAVPSIFLTAMTLLLPLAGIVTLIAAIDSLRRRRADPSVRTRALIGPAGITLMPNRGTTEFYRWDEIADAEAGKSILMLHLNAEGGRRTRRVIRYAALETSLATLQARIATAQARSRETVTATAMS